MVPLLRLAAATLLILTLGSCSYIYSLRALVIDGRLAFEVAPWSLRHPDCMRGVIVQVDENGPVATPGPGDSVGLMQNGGVYWWKQFDVSSCPNPFPIFYGQRLKGIPFEYNGQTDSVAAKPLVIGHVYEVSMESSGSGYGTGWFRITADRHVQNWREDPTPSVVNAQGYDITEGEQQPPPPDG